MLSCKQGVLDYSLMKSMSDRISCMKSVLWRISGLPVWQALNRTLKAWNWDLTNSCGKANAGCSGPEHILWIEFFLSTFFASTGLPACIPFHACTHPTNPIMNWDHTNSCVMYMQVQLLHPFLILCGKQLDTFSNREFKVIFSAVMVPSPNGGYITCTLIPQGKNQLTKYWITLRMRRGTYALFHMPLTWSSHCRISYQTQEHKKIIPSTMCIL